LYFLLSKLFHAIVRVRKLHVYCRDFPTVPRQKRKKIACLNSFYLTDGDMEG
jgi:hypothetical protein